MITDQMVIPVGYIKKPHGYKGSLGVEIFFERDIFSDSETPFFVKMDNILVPFFVDSIGGGADNMSYLKFSEINSDVDAAIFAKKELYARKSDVARLLGVNEEDLEDISEDYIGFNVVDSRSGLLIGTVTDILEGVEYDYFLVSKNDSDEEVEIPIVEEFIEEISEGMGEKQGVIKVSLPDGFFDF